MRIYAEPMMRILTCFVFLLCLGKPARACFILFLSDGKQVLVGNHEDWFAKDAAIRVIQPRPGRYGSVIFTFMNEGWAQGGMNEKGLFFDAAYTPFQEITFDSHATKHAGYIWQEVLDKASNVKDALALLMKYELPDLRESHIMLADGEGNAAIIGVQNGKVAVKQFQKTYLLQTNFNPWQPELSDEPVCWRYEKASKHLAQNGNVSLENLKSILAETHQDSLTVYSNIYDLKNKTIYTYNKRHFTKPITVNLPDLFQYGNCMLALDTLERDPGRWNKCAESNARSITIAGSVIDAKTRQPVPYANIGLPRRNLGTLSDIDGTFELVIPREFIDDSIFFSSIGFERQRILASSATESVVTMTPTHVMLNEVIIRSGKMNRRARLGWMGGKDGVLPFDTLQGGGEVALLIEAPRVPIYVDKLQVRLMYNSKDTLKFRLHFYAFDSLSQTPGAELLTREIMLTEYKRFGWLRFDLEKYDIRIMRKKFLVAFEWIDDRTTRLAMRRGLKDWESWKIQEFKKGNPKVEYIPPDGTGSRATYKYHGNMMNWPGFRGLPPFTGLMVETGKSEKTKALRTFERKASFGNWTEIPSTLNAVVTVAY
jgi:hypothetical protein